MKDIIKALFFIFCTPVFAQNSIHFPGEAKVEGGSYYIGTVFGDQDYIGNTNTSTPSFLIMKKEVTYQLYQEVQSWASQHGYSLGDACNGATIDGCQSDIQNDDQHPAVNVTWWDSMLFANALSEHQGLAPYYLDKNGAPLKAIPEINEVDGSYDIRREPEASGYRLPDMVAWHVAARGGHKGIEDGSYGYPHSGSPQPEKVANFPSEGGTVLGTLPVGSKLPNTLGIYDMSGNAAEWIDERNHYAQGILMYYYCGGSYQQTVSNVLSGCDVHSPGFGMPHIGFRLIRVIHE